MRRFDIYEDVDRDSIDAVKQGFSWPAFFFSWLWAFAKGLPLHGAALLAVWALVLTGSRLFDGSTLEDALRAVPLAAALWAGAFGNDWRRSSLEGGGAAKTGWIEASSARQAIRERDAADAYLVDRPRANP
jgi:hypothetical protein